jgi:hypothetical protein
MVVGPDVIAARATPGARRLPTARNAADDAVRGALDRGR